MFSQDNLIIPLMKSATSITSNVELDSFSMEGYEQATIIIMFSTTVTTNSTLVMECASTDSGDDSDATFHYRWGSAATGTATADVLGADQTTSSLSLNATTASGRILVLEISNSELPVSGSTVYENITIDIDGAASAGTAAAVAILSKPRHSRAIMPTAIPV